MTAFNAKPHEVRAMLGCDEFCRAKVHHCNVKEMKGEAA
jgi:hypothetical protein